MRYVDAEFAVAADPDDVLRGVGKCVAHLQHGEGHEAVCDPVLALFR